MRTVLLRLHLIVVLLFTGLPLPLHAAEGDYGRAQDTLEVEQSGNDAAMSLGFNAKFVTDALGPIEGDVLIQLSGPTTPAMFKSLDDSGYLAVVVPLRV